MSSDEQSIGNDAIAPIGYGRPPKHSQFKKGQSGNPRGRKARTRDVNTLLRDELRKKIQIRDGAGWKTVEKQEALVTALVNQAIAGKPAALRLLLTILELEVPREEFQASNRDEELLRRYLEKSKDGENGSTIDQ